MEKHLNQQSDSPICITCENLKGKKIIKLRNHDLLLFKLSKQIIPPFSFDTENIGPMSFSEQVATEFECSASLGFEKTFEFLVTTSSLKFSFATWADNQKSIWISHKASTNVRAIEKNGKQSIISIEIEQLIGMPALKVFSVFQIIKAFNCWRCNQNSRMAV